MKWLKLKTDNIVSVYIVRFLFTQKTTKHHNPNIEQDRIRFHNGRGYGAQAGAGD